MFCLTLEECQKVIDLMARVKLPIQSETLIVKGCIGKNRVISVAIEPTKETEAIVDRHKYNTIGAVRLGAGNESRWIISLVVLGTLATVSAKSFI